jgi:HAD superfamily hydrolase (TIGR01549 family)
LKARGVTFDFWDTLVADHPRQIRSLEVKAWDETLRNAGSAVDAGELAAAFKANWAEFERRWEANEGQHTPEDSTGFICERLGISPDGIRGELTAAFGAAGEKAPLEPAPELAATLRTLADAGLRLGIVCDVGLIPSEILRRRLEGFGLLRYFDAWSFSDETDWFKPAAQAFQPALDGLGTEPAETVHVGDSPRTDIAGALALGMSAIRYTGFVDRAPRDEDEPEAPFVVFSYARLPALLGL